MSLIFMKSRWKIKVIRAKILWPPITNCVSQRWSQQCPPSCMLLLWCSLTLLLLGGKVSVSNKRVYASYIIWFPRQSYKQEIQLLPCSLKYSHGSPVLNNLIILRPQCYKEAPTCPGNQKRMDYRERKRFLALLVLAVSPQLLTAALNQQWPKWLLPNS